MHSKVKVYRTSLEHFAVVYPQKKVCRPLGFVNLRHTVVARLPSAGEKVPVKGLRAQAHASGAGQGLPRQLQHLHGLVVRSRQCDSPHTLTFLCESPKELESWLSAFDPAGTTTLRDTLRAQPILEESDEMP
ncbi:Rho GTPase-activating protein 22 [Frankliniella fusca]|uniref:Rho GTPase-activating protein 22 n=1 Tax=Frankliniella fusca TaxID=407009 RepID=A0AAE1LDC9_9NEOP|nr:Rho GTPase-activating protein 22 [Frankliniella fusca]